MRRMYGCMKFRYEEHAILLIVESKTHSGGRESIVYLHCRASIVGEGGDVAIVDQLVDPVQSAWQREMNKGSMFCSCLTFSHSNMLSDSSRQIS
eukprot:763002-Hanusia_phi.AAC.1